MQQYLHASAQRELEPPPQPAEPGGGEKGGGTEADDPPRYRTEGRVELQVESPTGGVTLLTGRLEGQLAWDAANMPR